MEKIYSYKKPLKVEKVRIGYRVNYCIEETSEQEIRDAWNNYTDFEQQGVVPSNSFKDEHKYCYYSVIVPMGRYSYSGVVDAIIRDKYRVDEMESITNNMAAINAVFMQTLVTEGIVGATQYLRDSYDKDNAEVFKEMQEWRHMAKKEAKEVFKK